MVQRAERPRIPDRAADRADARQARDRAACRATAGCSSRSGTAFAPSSFATAIDVLHPEPRSEAARSLLPRAGSGAFAHSLPARCVVDGEIVIADRAAGSTSTRCSCACIRRRRASRSSPPRRRPRSSPSTCWRDDDRDLRSRPQAERRRLLEQALEQRRGRRPSHALQSRSIDRPTSGSIASRAPGSTA